MFFKANSAVGGMDEDGISPRSARGIAEARRLKFLKEGQCIVGWSQVYYYDGPLIVLSGVTLYLLASQAAAGVPFVQPLWMFLYSSLVIAVQWLVWRLFAPEVFAGQPGGFWRYFWIATLLFGVISGLGSLDVWKKKNYLVAVHVLLAILRGLCLLFTTVVWPTLLYYRAHKMRLRCGRKHLFTWMMFVSLTISGIGGALLVLGSSLAGIFYLSNVFFICFIAVNILIFDWRGKQTYHEAATITFCAAAVSAGPFVATVGFLGLRSAAFYTPILGMVYFLCIPAAAISLYQDLADLIQLENREVVQLPMFTIQIFQEFAIAVIFVDARPYSVEFLILLSIKILCNLMVDTGIFHNKYYSVFYKGENEIHKAIFMVKKYQFIRQKLLSERYAVPTFFLMVLFEYLLGDKLGYRLIASITKDETRKRLESALISLAIIMSCEVPLKWLSSWILLKRMMRLKSKALLTARRIDRRRSLEHGITPENVDANQLKNGIVPVIPNRERAISKSKSKSFSESREHSKSDKEEQGELKGRTVRRLSSRFGVPVSKKKRRGRSHSPFVGHRKTRSRPCNSPSSSRHQRSPSDSPAASAKSRKQSNRSTSSGIPLAFMDRKPQRSNRTLTALNRPGQTVDILKDGQDKFDEIAPALQDASQNTSFSAQQTSFYQQSSMHMSMHQQRNSLQVSMWQIPATPGIAQSTSTYSTHARNLFPGASKWNTRSSLGVTSQKNTSPTPVKSMRRPSFTKKFPTLDPVVEISAKDDGFLRRTRMYRSLIVLGGAVSMSSVLTLLVFSATTE